jgi:hypothetical protein
MKLFFSFAALFLGFAVFGQTPTEQAQPIVQEGKLLYRSEMASWYGTDLFLEKYSNRDNIGGYFSYTDGAITKCIFFAKEKEPKVIGTINFDSTYNVKTANVDLPERDFTDFENQLYQLRKISLEEITSDTSLFKRYENTELNLIPLISNDERKVYVLTGPQQNGVVLIGNDYLLTFDENNHLLTKKRLHQNLIPIYYGEQEKNGQQVEGAMHSHFPQTGDFITATDICTLMLYEKFAKWKTHQVVSQKYLNIWNCETNTLTVILMDTIDKINKDQEKRSKKRGN